MDFNLVEWLILLLGLLVGWFTKIPWFRKEYKIWEEHQRLALEHHKGYYNSKQKKWRREMLDYILRSSELKNHMLTGQIDCEDAFKKMGVVVRGEKDINFYLEEDFNLKSADPGTSGRPHQPPLPPKHPVG